MRKHNRQATLAHRGQAALSLVFLIGGIIIFIGTTLAFVVISFINSSFGFQAANRAEALALGGIEDGLLQIARSNVFSDTVGYCIPYALPPCGSGSADVTVQKDVPISGDSTITATSTVSLYTRELQAIVSINGTTGAVSVISLKSIVL